MAAVALLAPASAHGAKGMEVALSDDPVFLATAYYDRDAALDNARQLGATRIRAIVTWAAVLGKQGEATEKPAELSYYWGWYEQLIDAAARKGIRVQLVLAPPAPRWATADGQIGVTRPDPKLFAEFARAAATRFKGRVDRYSLWNEPNHDGWLQPTAEAPALYRSLYAAGYAAVRAVDPKATILFAETSPYGGSRAMAPLAFLRRVACVTAKYRVDRKCVEGLPPEARAPLVADGYGHHPYEFKHAPDYKYKGADNVTIGTLSRLTKALDRLAKARVVATRKGKPLSLFLTEFGYFASGPRATTEENRAKWLPQAFGIAQKNKRVKQMLHYGLVAPPPTQAGAAFDFGLLLIDGSHRPAYPPLVKWASKAMKKKLIARPRGAIALPAAQPNADPPGEPPPPEPEPCTLPVFGFPCP